MGRINYGVNGDVVVIEVRDNSGAKIDRWIIPIRDRKKTSSILNYLKEKYGFEPEINPNNPNKPTNVKLDTIEDWWE